MAQVDGDLVPLRAARIHLLAVTLYPWALSDARSLASIDVALAAIEDRRRLTTRRQAR